MNRHRPNEYATVGTLDLQTGLEFDKKPTTHMFVYLYTVQNSRLKNLVREHGIFLTLRNFFM